MCVAYHCFYFPINAKKNLFFCTCRRNQFLNQSFSSVRDLRRENKAQQHLQQLQQLRQLQLNERPLYRKENNSNKKSPGAASGGGVGGGGGSYRLSSARSHEGVAAGRPEPKDLFLANRRK